MPRIDIIHFRIQAVGSVMKGSGRCHPRSNPKGPSSGRSCGSNFLLPRYSLLFEIWFNMIGQNGDKLCAFIALGSSRGGIYSPPCRKPRRQPVQPHARMGGRRLSSVAPRPHNTFYEAKETCAWSVTRTSLFSWLVANPEWFEQGTDPGAGHETQPDDKQHHVHLVPRVAV